MARWVLLLSTSASCDITGRNQFLEAQPERGMPSSEGVEERRSRHQNGWNWNRVLAGMAQSPILRISAVRVLQLRTNCGKSQFSLVLPFNLSPGQPGDVLGGHCLKCYLRLSWKTLHALFYLLLPAYMSTTCVSTTCVSTTYVSGIGGGQREGTRSLEVELQERVSLSVCTGYRSRILWLSIPNPLEEPPVLSTA